jgi:hypothetical protein
LKEWHRKSEKYPALKRNRPSHGVDGLQDDQGGGENLAAITREKQIIKPITGVEIYKPKRRMTTPLPKYRLAQCGIIQASYTLYGNCID